jgi:hypothetical protein
MRCKSDDTSQKISSCSLVIGGLHTTPHPACNPAKVGGDHLPFLTLDVLVKHIALVTVLQGSANDREYSSSCMVNGNGTDDRGILMPIF